MLVLAGLGNVRVLRSRTLLLRLLIWLGRVGRVLVLTGMCLGDMLMLLLELNFLPALVVPAVDLVGV